MNRDRIEWHGTHAYATCHYCQKLVRVNKRVVGGMHICLTEEERAAMDERERRRLLRQGGLRS